MILSATGQLLVYGLRPLLSYAGLAVGAGAAELGAITAAFSALSLLAAVPFGYLIDRTGERPFVVAGTFALLVVPTVLLAPQSIGSLLACSAVLGLGQLAGVLGVQTLIARGASEAVRDRRFAHFTVVNSGAQLLAPAMLGVLVVMSPRAGRQGPPVLDASAALLAAIAVAALGLVAAVSLWARPGRLAARSMPMRRPLFAAMRGALRLPSMRNAMLASFTVLASVDLVAAYLPALGDVRGLEPRTVGFLLATLGAASLLARLGLPKLMVVLSRRSLLAVCMAVAALGMTAIPYLTWLPGLYVVMAVTGVGLGLGQPITMGWVAGEVAPEIRGTAMSVRLMGNRLGQTIVPLFVGGVAGASGLAAAFVVPAAMLAGAAVVVAGVAPRHS
jgi:MFS family permease